MSQSKEYSEIKAISQSSLKTLDTDPKKFYNEEELFLNGTLNKRPERGGSDAMLLGDITETLLFNPEEFPKQYVVISEVPPTGQMLDFTNSYLKFEREATFNYNQSITKEKVQEIAEASYHVAGFKRDKFEKVLERFKTEALSYYNKTRAAYKSEMKTVSSEIKREADKRIYWLKSHEFIAPIVNAKTNEFIEVLDQLEIVFDYCINNEKTIKVKGALDRVIINHFKKTIYLYDFKTTSDYFLSSYTSYRYDLQGAFYTDLIFHYILDIRPELRLYTVAPFTFVVSGPFENRNEIWEMTPEDLAIGRNGGKNTYNRPIKGYKQLLDDYHWHKENNKWDFAREVYENNGRKILNCFV